MLLNCKRWHRDTHYVRLQAMHRGSLPAYDRDQSRQTNRGVTLRRAMVRTASARLVQRTSAVPLLVLPLGPPDPPPTLDPLEATGSGSPPPPAGPRVKLTSPLRKVTRLTAPPPARTSLRATAQRQSSVEITAAGLVRSRSFLLMRVAGKRFTPCMCVQRRGTQSTPGHRHRQHRNPDTTVTC